MSSTSLSAAAAAKQILGFYDTIPAADQRAFTAGFVELLSTFPFPVIERAISPSRGLPAYVPYPNLAKFRELLDEWCEIYWEEQSRKRIAPPADAKRSRPGRLENPPPGHFGKMFVPANHARYAGLCEWAKTAEAKWWRFGKSSDGRDGIWVPINVFEEGQEAMKAIERAKTMTMDDLLSHYQRHGLRRMPKAGAAE